MKSLSVKQPWASLLLTGEKLVECRTWQTSYRGELLICSSKGDFVCDDGFILPGGYALGVVKLYDIRRMTREDLEKAVLLDGNEKNVLRGYAWHIKPVRSFVPVPIKGKLNLFETDVSSFKEIPDKFEEHAEYLKYLQKMPYRLKDGTTSEDYN